MLGGLLITDLGLSMGDIVAATGIGKLFVVSEKFFVLPTRVTPPGMLLTLDFGSRDGTGIDTTGGNQTPFFCRETHCLDGRGNRILRSSFLLNFPQVLKSMISCHLTEEGFS